MKGIDNFLDNEQRIKSWPSKQEAKLEILKHLAASFEYGTFYTEKEVNRIIDKAHTFGDYFLLRRGLIESKLLCRTRNGYKYWKSDVWPLSDKVETERLIIIDSSESEESMLKEIYMSCSYMGEWTGKEHTPQYIDELLTKNPLPPNGSIEFHKVKSIYKKDNSEIIGVLAYYLGYPNSDTLWIGLLLLNKDAQRQGFGSEITEYVLKAAEKTGMKKAGIGVYLKNWPALRFWTKQGFNKITGIYGDTTYSTNTFSLAGLEKELAFESKQLVKM